MLTAEVKSKITTAGLVQTGYEVFRGKIPASPNKCIVLYETAGLIQENFFGGSTTVEQPGLQVVTRGDPDDYDEPRLAIERIVQGMNGWGAFVVSGVRYLRAGPQQQPFKFNQDELMRVLFAVNVLFMKEPSPLS